MTEVDKMSRDLVVTHETALSPDLQRKVSALVEVGPGAPRRAEVWPACYPRGGQVRYAGAKCGEVHSSGLSLGHCVPHCGGWDEGARLLHARFRRAGHREDTGARRQADARRV